MQVIIIGIDRVDVCDIKDGFFSTKEDKHFLKRRAQIYSVYPEMMRRMRCRDESGEYRTDEVLVYKENAIIPYHPREEIPEDEYAEYIDKTLAQIDLHKSMHRGMFGGSMFLQKAGNIWAAITPFAGFAILGLILLYAFVFA